VNQAVKSIINSKYSILTMAQKITKQAAPVKPTTAAKPTVKTTEARPVHFIFDKGNYRLLIISIAVVTLGFILMAGRTDIYSTTKIVIAPLVILAGFALGFFAIFKKPVNG
jgi:type IV secretory pathway VirB2 component (pilin)